MNKKEDEECMSLFLNKVIVNGIQDPGLSPFEDFLPRSAPLVDFLSTPEQVGSILQLTQFTESRGIEVYHTRCWVAWR